MLHFAAFYLYITLQQRRMLQFELPGTGGYILHAQ